MTRLALMVAALAMASWGTGASARCPPGDGPLLGITDCDWRSIADPAGDAAISQFQDVARDNGLAGGLRTFARNGDFRLYLEGGSAMELGVANKYLDRRPWAGTWQESARGSSPDSTLLYAVGEVALAKGDVYQYAQVWQFDPKVANWGMKLLLLWRRAV